MLAPHADSGRRRAFVLLAVAVLALHAGLLGGIDAGVPAPDGPRLPAVELRALPPETAAVLVQAPPAGLVPTGLAPALPRPRAPAPGRAPQAQRGPVESAMPVEVPAPPVSQAAMPSEPGAEATASAPVPLVAEARSAQLEAASPDVPLPTYRTRMPPAATLRYDLQRGRFGGTGELRWQPVGARYELRLEGSVGGIGVLTQVSQGGFDAAGLAPQRFTDQRARRPAQAANFQREAGKVTFSGPSLELPLWRGVQDRLSWMIQLAAVAAAEPSLRESQAKVVLQVVGARGDAGLWVFRCLGAESLDAAAGPIDVVHFSREPRGPYDTGVEVWLDPARHFLPVRATTRNGDDGEGMDLRLREAVVGG
jgi:hypothetical protein